MNYKLSLIPLAVLLQGTNANAAEVDAQSLLGNFYSGIHGAYLKADDDRLSGNEEFDKGWGLGVEGGYRLLKELELRLTYTRLEADLEQGGSIDSIDRISFDALYFPTAKNVYLLGGVNTIDYDASAEVAASLGVGYRHYFTQRIAGYAEGKANYQFEDSYTDAIIQFGLVYYFGQDKSAPIASVQENVQEEVEEVKQEEVKQQEVVTVVDADNDGILDTVDKCPSSAEGDKVDSTGCTILGKGKDTYRLSINFDSNKADIKAQYYPELEELAAFLNRYPDLEVTIDGYTSTLGNAEYNKSLSQRRAEAVVDMLASKYNVDKSRMTPIGHGETNLLDTANTREAHIKNRRIELHIAHE